MLNLSDKDLDRLSQEAAQQHEPGDIFGPKLWEKLEARLDRDLGKVTPNPARGIRRLPYYYAPALLVILGVTYYLVRPGSKSHKGMSSGSPPLSVIQPAPANPLKPVRSSSNPVPSDNSNSTPTAPSNTVPYPGSAGTSPAAASAHTAADASPNAPAASVRPGTPAPSRSDVSARPLTRADRPGSHPSSNQHLRRNKPTGSHPYRAAGDASASNTAPTDAGATSVTGTPATANTTGNPGTPATATSQKPGANSPRDLKFSAVRDPVRIARLGSIDNSALRASLASNRPPIHYKDGLRINRSLVFGAIGGPDYASVNSFSGQRPGSTIGATIDYQFVNHLYIGTGLLFSRKIFAAFPQDYHVPDNYYRTAGMAMGGGVDYIEGSFTMLEVPLNLRWDFITNDNSLFYLGVGTSSYFFARQNCGYYFNFYNPRTLDSKEISYTNQPSALFASLNFSAGAEVGLTNSLSFLIGGYVKTPTRGIGFGQVDLTSFGLTFGVHYAPIISRKRR